MVCRSILADIYFGDLVALILFLKLGINSTKLGVISWCTDPDGIFFISTNSNPSLSSYSVILQHFAVPSFQTFLHFSFTWANHIFSSLHVLTVREIIPPCYKQAWGLVVYSCEQLQLACVVFTLQYIFNSVILTLVSQSANGWFRPVSTLFSGKMVTRLFSRWLFISIVTVESQICQ